MGYRVRLLEFVGMKTLVQMSNRDECFTLCKTSMLSYINNQGDNCTNHNCVSHKTFKCNIHIYHLLSRGANRPPCL